MFRYLIIFFLSTHLLFSQTFNLAENFHQNLMQNLLEPQFTLIEQSLLSDYESSNYDIYNSLEKPQRELLKDTAYTQLALISAVGILWVMPESITNWDKDDIRNNSLANKWRENVGAGPVFDEDDFIINYIGHPVSGAIYYVMARNDGIDPFGSFAFSFAMSSFFWEYGYESLAEVPSMQDLVSTPIVGALMGEYMYYLEKQLDLNSGLIWGSRALGMLAYAFLDPMGRLAQSFHDFIDTEVDMYYMSYQMQSDRAQKQYNRTLNKPEQFANYSYGFMIDFRF
jgi:hypothetical protein